VRFNAEEDDAQFQNLEHLDRAYRVPKVLLQRMLQRRKRKIFYFLSSCGFSDAKGKYVDKFTPKKFFQNHPKCRTWGSLARRHKGHEEKIQFPPVCSIAMQSVDKFAQIPSFRRKPESRRATRNPPLWIPAFAGMTQKSILSTDWVWSGFTFFPILIPCKNHRGIPYEFFTSSLYPT